MQLHTYFQIQSLPEITFSIPNPSEKNVELFLCVGKIITGWIVYSTYRDRLVILARNYII